VVEWAALRRSRAPPERRARGWCAVTTWRPSNHWLANAVSREQRARDALARKRPKSSAAPVRRGARNSQMYEAARAAAHGRAVGPAVRLAFLVITPLGSVAHPGVGSHLAARHQSLLQLGITRSRGNRSSVAASLVPAHRVAAHRRDLGSARRSRPTRDLYPFFDAFELLAPAGRL
jgi:hypothetical protein